MREGREVIRELILDRFKQGYDEVGPLEGLTYEQLSLALMLCDEEVLVHAFDEQCCQFYR